MTAPHTPDGEPVADPVAHHLLWAVHHAHQDTTPDRAALHLRRELNRIIRGWNR